MLCAVYRLEIQHVEAGCSIGLSVEKKKKLLIIFIFKTDVFRKST
jgi:hypothetical protein